jgi:hypothetical protein
MTDQLYGLGAIPSPFDPNDYPITALYEALGVEPPDVAALGSIYASTPVPPILNQGNTPQCTCFGTKGMKQFQDHDDTSVPTWYNFDAALMFSRVKGTAAGAVVRDVLDQLLKVGYPLVGNSGAAADHKIAGYYAVPIDIPSIKQAIATFGEIVMGMTWANSWRTPHADGSLPAFDYAIGGHLVRVRGWNDGLGIRIPNSWGAAWGANGECYLPYDQLSHVWEVWKAPDQPRPTPPPPPPTPPVTPTIFHWHVAAGAKIRVYPLRPVTGCILPGWSVTINPTAFSAPCTVVAHRVTCDGQSGAYTVKVLSGKYYGKTVGVDAGSGTTVS